jgi:DNA-binding response OmpR family regulator
MHRLLIVEDHSATRHALRGLFRLAGWHVSTAGSVTEGLALLDAEPEPCCLVLDLKLPDGDGETVLCRVRERGLRTRVVVCSGLTDEPKRLEALKALEPDAVLTKPLIFLNVWGGVCRVCQGAAGGDQPRPHIGQPDVRGTFRGSASSGR